ncbi:Hypothetical_protein [Hexamita inflata]|uniref:Hypothetical_protein n=1 Tax=Hexamita inflata TaxID=28002 RepID=A0AA86P7Y7_9EUKA|nr:Hypothetical protein HINF_LOCUS19705 [Hexamita inflata]
MRWKSCLPSDVFWIICGAGKCAERVKYEFKIYVILPLQNLLQLQQKYQLGTIICHFQDMNEETQNKIISNSLRIQNYIVLNTTNVLNNLERNTTAFDQRIYNTVLLQPTNLRT